MSVHPQAATLLSMLPAQPSDWTFVVIADCVDRERLATIAQYGFTTAPASDLDGIERLTGSGHAILLADCEWLKARADAIGPQLAKLFAQIPNLHLVALALPGDGEGQATARQFGAALILAAPVDVSELLVELAGLAWSPRLPYHILLIDPDADALGRHERTLQAAGCRVLALEAVPNSPQALENFSPEACVLEVALSRAHGRDFLPRSASGDTLPPILYFTDLEAQTATLPVAAAIARARWFRLLAFDRPAPQRRDGVTAPAGGTHSRRILVADDHPANLAVLRLQLKTLGHECLCAADGQAALAVCREQRCDLLLADINMPVLDGLALTRAIRASEAESGGHLPIIGITALDLPEDFQSCIEAGMDDVLAKPIELAPLHQALERWLKGGATTAYSALPVLDRNLLRRVTGEEDAPPTSPPGDFGRELLALFVSVAREDAGGCQALLRQKDGPGLVLLMHRLKSSARMMGALRCEALARCLEAAARTGDLGHIDSRLQALEIAISEVEQTSQSLPSADALVSRASVPAVAMDISAEAILGGLRRNEICVHFQPKADLAGLRVVGAEALARWPERAPAAQTLITTAEALGLAGPVCELLLTKTLIDGTRLADAGFILDISFNLAAGWLADPRLAAFVKASLLASGFPAERLILEVGEATVAHASVAALDNLKHLSDLGCRLSIGDYGAAFSSPEQLQKLALAEIKLDRGLPRLAGASPTARAILSAGVEVARQFQIPSVAVAVETQDQLDLLRELGCDQMQGWLLAKAMPAAEMIVWLKQRRL